MKTLVLAADTADARKAIAGAGLRKAKCSIIASWHDLRGRSTGGQPRIITSSFWERPDALKIHDALEVADKSPA